MAEPAKSATLTPSQWIDEYPSRMLGRATAIPRKDPVVYGKWFEGAPLTQEQASFYSTSGYLTFDLDLSAASLHLLNGEAKRLLQEEGSSHPNLVIREPGSDEVRSIFQIQDLSETLAKLILGGRLVEIARFLLGDDVYVHQSRLNYKPGFLGKEFHWHSDFETWHVEDGMPRMRALSMSIALTENNEFNGPLMVIPGSHMQFLGCVGQTPDNHYKTSLQKQEYGVPDPRQLTELSERGAIVAPKGPAGTVTLFDCNMMHGSNSNISPYPRSNIFVVYNAVSNRLVSPFGGMPPRPEFLAARGDRAVAI